MLDGELVIPNQPFDTLQLRLHPADSRASLLSRQHPAQFIAFDLLADNAGASLLRASFAERRAALEAFARGANKSLTVALSQSTHSAETARKWLRHLGHGHDGIVAKNLDLAYRPG